MAGSRRARTWRARRCVPEEAAQLRSSSHPSYREVAAARTKSGTSRSSNVARGGTSTVEPMVLSGDPTNGERSSPSEAVSVAADSPPKGIADMVTFLSNGPQGSGPGGCNTRPHVRCRSKYSIKKHSLQHQTLRPIGKHYIFLLFIKNIAPSRRKPPSFV